MLVKTQTMDLNGVIQREVVINQTQSRIPEHIETIKKCFDLTDEDPCDKAFAFHKCIKAAISVPVN